MLAKGLGRSIAGLGTALPTSGSNSIWVRCPLGDPAENRIARQVRPASLGYAPQAQRHLDESAILRDGERGQRSTFGRG